MSASTQNIPTRPRGGRGANKRRAGAPLQTERDGDIVMSTETLPPNGRGRGRGRGRGQNTNNDVFDSRQQRTNVQGSGRGNNSQPRDFFRRNSPKSNVGGYHQLAVTGFRQSKAASNSDGGVKSLTDFLERKTSTRIHKSRVSGDAYIISVRAEDVDSFTRINGFAFAGATLTIKQDDAVSNQAKESTKEVIRAILNRRYNQASKFLDLSALSADEDIQRTNLFDFSKVGHGTESKLFQVLLQLFADAFPSEQVKRESLESVSLARNGLESVATVLSLSSEFPNLKNLDLADNNLKSLGALGKWKRSFKDLDTLLLNRNPIEQTTPKFNEDMVRWYPKLRILNDVLVRTPDQLAASSAPVTLPYHPPQLFDSSGVAEQFLLNFFDNYDQGRPAVLQQYYDADSVFSLSVNTAAVTQTHQRTAPGTWAAHIKESRNLKKLHSLNAKVAKEHIGLANIEGAWANMPRTKHPNIRDTGKWVVEGFPVGDLPQPGSPVRVNGELITVHGEFEEELTGGGGGSVYRSFDRTFILGPGAQQGSVRVVSDMLVLRAYAGSAEEQKRKQMVLALSQATKMNLHYSTMCLEESGWNWELALANFEKAKATLPAEAAL